MLTLFTLISFVLLLIAAIYLKWWVTLLFLGVWLIFAWVAGRRFQRALEEGVSRSRGFVLRDATVATDAIGREPVDEHSMTLKIELTITPRPGNAQLRPWEPERLRLYRPGIEAALDTESIELGVLDGWSARAPAPVKGKQRVRLTVSVPPDTARLDLRYFLEDLADIDLIPLEPAPAALRNRTA